MMPFDSKLQFQTENAIASQLDLHNSTPTIAMPFENIVPLKTSSEIKKENGGIGAEREGSNDSQLGCLKCQSLQQKLKISRSWNRFYKEKVVNVDKVLHIITEYEREKQKNLELQLAYDQRSREWAQQQEQLINLLTEVQPLRKKLKFAEETLEKEIKERLKHQYMQESLKVTIQQLQAKVLHMNTIANPVFVENLEKKLSTSRSESKKVKCNLEFKKAEVAELRSYISDKNIQVENLTKKLYWAYFLANKYIKNESEENEDNILERDVLTYQTKSTLQSLNALYDTFYQKKKKEYKEKQIPLACLPSFAEWSSDFEKKEYEEETPGEDDFVIKKESSKFEKEAFQLEKLLSEVHVEEVFANIGKYEIVSDDSVHQPSLESPSKFDISKTNNVEDTSKRENKKIPSAIKKGKKSFKTQKKDLSPSPKKTNKKEKKSFKTRKKHLSPSPKKTNNSKSTEDMKDSEPESETKLESSCKLFKNFMDKPFKTPTKPVSSRLIKSSRKKSAKKNTPKTPEFVTKSTVSNDLHLSDSSFISDSSDSDKDDEPLSKLKKSLISKGVKAIEKLTSPRDKKLLVTRKRKRSYTSTTTTNNNNNTADGSGDEETKRLKDIEQVRKIISEMTGVPPLGHFPYLEDTDSSPERSSQIKSTKSSKELAKNIAPTNSPVSGVQNESLILNIDSEDRIKSTSPQFNKQVRALKKLPIKKINSQKRKLPSVEIDDDKSFVPQRITRSSRKHQKKDVYASSEIKYPQVGKTIKESQLKESTLFLPDNESYFISPSPIQSRSRSRNNSKNSDTSYKEHTANSNPSPDVSYKDISLDLNLSMSSSNTDTEENEIDKLVEKISESSVKNNQDVSIHESDSSTTSRSIPPSSFKEMEGRNEIEKTNSISFENKKHEDYLSANKELENFLPDKVVEENSVRVSSPSLRCKDVDMEKDSLKESNTSSDRNCSLIMSEILNEDTITFISPISSPVKRPNLKSNEKIKEEFPQKEENGDVLEYQSSPEKDNNVTTMEATMNNEVSSTKITEDFNDIISAAKVADGVETTISELKLCTDKSEEKTLIINVNKKLKDLFSDDLDKPSTSALDMAESNRTISESSAESVALSDSSLENNNLGTKSGKEDDCGKSVSKDDCSKSVSKDSTNQGWEEDENSLVMDIEDDEFPESDSDNRDSSEEDKVSFAKIENKKIEFKPLEPLVDSKINYVDGNTSSVQEVKLLSVSFYKERQNTTEQTDFQIPNIIFGENSTTEDSIVNGNPNVQEENDKSLVKDSPEHCPPVNLPLIRSHPDFQEATLKLGASSYLNLEEYLEELLGCHIGGPDWNSLIENIITHIDNIKSPKRLGKFHPIVRNILMSVLRTSPCEKRDPRFSIPLTIYKLFHIVRILENHFNLPAFTLDSLVNASAHKLILTRKLRPHSLSSLTTWVMSSCNAQYHKLESPFDEESLRWGRGFLTDLLFHHKGFVHESLLTAVASSRKIFVRMVKYRDSTNLEKLIYWIGHHGDWEGPKITRSNLIEALNHRVGLKRVPLINPSNVIKAILLVLINNEANKDELASCKSAFLLYLKWVPVPNIIKALFPILKNVYYEEDVISHKPSLEEVKNLIESSVKIVKWDGESEVKFIHHLKCFPIIKN